MENQTQEVGFPDALARTVAVVEEVKSLAVVDAQSHALMESKVSDIRKLEKELDSEYKNHPAIIEAKKLQAVKGDLAKMLEDARKGGKSKQFAWQEEEAVKRRAEEARIAAELKRKADEEAAAAAKIAKEAADKAAAEAAVLAEAERKRAEAARKEAARARARGDEEALRMAQEKQAAAKAEVERIKAEAAAEAERARIEAERVAAENAAAPAPVVVLPDDTPKAKGGRVIWKFRLTGKPVPAMYTMPDEVKIGKLNRDTEGEMFQGQDWITVYSEKC